jgi:DNA-binding transcriptional ArsR family regulator
MTSTVAEPRAPRASRARAGRSAVIEIVGAEGPAAHVTTDEDRAYQRAATIGRAMADPKRLCVLESLADGELSVSELSGRVRCQVPNMSQHLAVLRSAGLVTTRREGSTVFYRLSDPRVLQAYQLIQDIAR